MTADGYATDQDRASVEQAAENARLRADLATVRERIAAALDAEAAVWRSMAIVGLSAADVADTLEGFAAAVRTGTPAPPLVDEQEGE